LKRNTAAVVKRPLYQLAIAAFEEDGGGQRQQLSQQLKAKENYLLYIMRIYLNSLQYHGFLPYFLFRQLVELQFCLEQLQMVNDELK
jgi:hypothetical protein